MRFKDFLPVLKNVAPAIATALGGPAAGIATKFLGNALLGDENADPEAILEAAQSPENLVKLKQIDADFKVKMAEAGIKLEKVHAEDRAGARAMAIAKGQWPQIILSTVYVLSFSMAMYFTLTAEGEFSDAQLAIIGPLIGILSYGLAQIMNFWFGSSSGSKEKTAIMGAIAHVT